MKRRKIVNVLTVGGGTATIEPLRAGKVCPDFVFNMKPYEPELLRICQDRKSKAGFAGSLLVFGWLREHVRNGSWGPICGAFSAFVDAGWGSDDDWTRGLDLLLVAGIVKRGRAGGLMPNPLYLYKGGTDDWMEAMEKYNLYK